MLKKSLLLLMLLFVLPAHSAQTVREFKGTGNATTATFVVESPWLLDWRLDGDYDRLLALDISLIDVTNGRHVGRVLHTERRGNGVKLFMEKGQYQLRVSSTLARWTIKIQQIEPEEAKLYTPRPKIAP